MMEANYYNAYDAIERGYHKTENEKSRERFSRFYHIAVCPACGGSRYSQKALSTLLGEKNIAQVSALTLEELKGFTQGLAEGLPLEMQPIRAKLTEKFYDYLRPLLGLGLTYLSLNRNGNSLSTGELQRLQLARTLRNEPTGVLYVLDEPSIGLHPANVGGLFEVFDGLLKQGNSLVVVEHDVDVLLKAQYVIEMGSGAGKNGGALLNAGSVEQVAESKTSLIGPHLNGKAKLLVRKQRPVEELFEKGAIHLEIDELHTLYNISAAFPIGCLTAVTGVSGAGKTALVLDSLVAALEAKIKKKLLPDFIKKITRNGIRRVVTVDATPVGKNNRSTVATYSGILDGIRNLFAATELAKELGWDAGHFSYNTQEGACETCGGSGHISLDVQFLPDVDLLCPTCGGSRYNVQTLQVQWQGLSVAEVLALTLDEALEVFKNQSTILPKIEALTALGLGYLALGEATPLLSGEEAQRLKLVAEIGKMQKGTLFVFDEPTTGFHPQDIRTLLVVFDTLISAGGTVIVIEHDLDLIANADYVIDMGPGGGIHGGRVVFAGSPGQLCKIPGSVTGRYLKAYWARYEE